MLGFSLQGGWVIAALGIGPSCLYHERSLRCQSASAPACVSPLASSVDWVWTRSGYVFATGVAQVAFVSRWASP